MRPILNRMSAGLLFTFLSGALAWAVVPETVATVLLKLNNASAGLSERSITTDIGDINYLEGGEGKTIVLIHGIYARKEHWVELARHLVDDYHVIALDLPGFGDNEILEDDQYLLTHQKENLLTVLDALEVDSAHIAANSMGAYVAILLSVEQPDRVATFAFIGSPLGVKSALKSDMDLALEQGIKPLVAHDEMAFHARMDWLSPNSPYVPGPILNSWMQSEVSMAYKNKRIWDFVHNFSTAPTVLDLAPALAMDSLVIWCREDRIFHVSGAEILARELDRATLSILDGCGHVPMLDSPDKVAEIYLDFLTQSAAQ